VYAQAELADEHLLIYICLLACSEELDDALEVSQRTGRLQGQQQGGYQGQQQQQQQPREFSSEPPTNLQQRVQRDQQRRQSNGPADGFVVNEEIRFASKPQLVFTAQLSTAACVCMWHRSNVQADTCQIFTAAAAGGPECCSFNMILGCSCVVTILC
jgi:hypothetical protein